MAHANIKERVDFAVNLDLNGPEAATLMYILDRIGGSESRTAREYAASIRNALISADVMDTVMQEYFIPGVEGEITFTLPVHGA